MPPCLLSTCFSLKNVKQASRCSNIVLSEAPGMQEREHTDHTDAAPPTEALGQNIKIDSNFEFSVDGLLNGPF